MLIVGCQTPKEQSKSEDSSFNYYTEEHRPQYHFSPEANWMNDPNGMVYHDGEYHLFYQYYPDSTVWGPMHWGHAVSEDLTHWEHLPVALYPDSLGYIFSGSAVIDHYNTSGLGKNGSSPMIAIFTHHNMDGERNKTNKFQYQSIAYSNDNGRTFIKYEGNPVVSNPGIKDFRDPKVIWHEDSQKWIMVFAAYDKVRIYNSPNLIDWTYQSEFGIPGDTRLWECPDLFPMTVEGTNETKWVLITSIQKEGPNGGTATSYFVGDFDGKKFNSDYTNQKWADFGTDNYAMVTWSDVLDSDGRVLALGWMSNWQYAQIVPTEKWRSAMTLPRELSLHKVEKDHELRSQPVRELAQLEQGVESISKQSYSEGIHPIYEEVSGLMKIQMEVKKPSSSNFAVRFSNSQKEYIDVGFLGVANNYFIDRSKSGKVAFSDEFSRVHTAPIHYYHENLVLTIYLDHSSVELFVDEGRIAMTDIFFSNEPFTKVDLVVLKGTVDVLGGKGIELERIWRK